jgi:ABC-type polar amino acid transport system ATPase subunit
MVKSNDELIGRQGVMAALRDHLVQGTSVFVIGDGGVGKTAILRELARTVAASLWQILKEADAQRLGRYGKVDERLGPVLDPKIASLEKIIIEMEDLITGPQRSAS